MSVTCNLLRHFYDKCFNGANVKALIAQLEIISVLCNCVKYGFYPRKTNFIDPISSNFIGPISSNFIEITRSHPARINLIRTTPIALGKILLTRPQNNRYHTETVRWRSMSARQAAGRGLRGFHAHAPGGTHPCRPSGAFRQ